MGEWLPHRTIHLIGIGGAGMSALARVLSGAGHTVTGSDLYPSGVLDSLRDIGLVVWAGHKPERVQAADLVVASSAVPATDPEWQAAMAAGTPCWMRPQLLEEMTSRVRTVGATGTHGKSSTSAMLVTALRHVGVSPSFVVGADLVDLRTNAAYGSDPLLVLEADEAFGTFESLHLTGLIVTNVAADHLDHFGTVEEVEAAFTRVVRKVEGPVVACADDPGSAALAARTGVMTYGLAPESTFVIAELEQRSDGFWFRIQGPDLDQRAVSTRPGLHMLRNAAAVLALGSLLGYDPAGLASGLERFHGIRRRFEHRGTVGGVTVIDDYAHHPTEVSATIRAARQTNPARLVAVFQPHLYSRTERLAGEFGSALALADVVIVTDVYGSREAPIPGVTGELVSAASIRAGADPVSYVAHRADLAEAVASVARAGDVVVLMGAGDITVVAGELIQLLDAAR